MDIALMRLQIAAVYDFKPGWLKKIDAMPDNQVCAIWYRFNLLGMDPSKICKKPRYLHKRHSHTMCYCHTCHTTWYADNPDILDCPFCGNETLEKEYVYEFN